MRERPSGCNGLMKTDKPSVPLQLRSASPSDKTGSLNGRSESPKAKSRLRRKDDPDNVGNPQTRKSASGLVSDGERRTGPAKPAAKGSAKKVSAANLPEPKNAFTVLGKLKDCQQDAKEELACKKLTLCTQIYDYNADGTVSHQQERECKRKTLLELVEYIATAEGLTENLMTHAIRMVSKNIFRGLIIRDRSPLDIGDPEGEEPYEDPSWPHLEPVYEFFLRFVTNKELNSTNAAGIINAKLIPKLVGLFDSDDPRERDFLKTILQRIYSKFVSLRTCIRRTIQDSCYKASYENEMQNGISEQLEIMNNIINAFKVPLKAEHNDVLLKVLIPLHKTRSLPSYHQNLMACLKLFALKEPKLISTIVFAMLQLWPWRMAVKQVLFLDTIEELLDITKGDEFKKMQKELVPRLALCVSSTHSHVAERVLALWQNEDLVKLFNQHRRNVFPPVIRALYKNQKQHWSPSVGTKTADTLKQIMEVDRDIFDTVTADIRRTNAQEAQRDAVRTRKWAHLERLFQKKGGQEGVRRHSLAILAKQHEHTVKTLGSKGSQPLVKGRYGLGITWDRDAATQVSPSPVLQAVCIDDSGTIVDAVYDSRPQALNGAVVHSGGPKSVGNTEYGSIIWVTMSSIKEKIQVIYFVVACPVRGHLKDVPGGKLHVIEEEGARDVAAFALDADMSSMGIVASVKRSSVATWSMNRLEEFTKNGRHFMDAAEPLLGNLIRTSIPDAPKGARQKVQVPMMRGSIACMPLGSHVKWIFLGVGWDLAPSVSGTGVGMEVSAVFFDEGGVEIGAAGPLQTSNLGAKYTGRSMLGAAFGIDWECVPKEVSQIFIVGNVKQEGHSFALVQSPTCRVLDRMGAELARFKLPSAGEQCGFIWARLFREKTTRRWCLQEIGAPCDGQTHKESLEELKELFNKSPKQFQEQELAKLNTDTVAGKTADPPKVSPTRKKKARRIVSL